MKKGTKIAIVVVVVVGLAVGGYFLYQNFVNKNEGKKDDGYGGKDEQKPPLDSSQVKDVNVSTASSSEPTPFKNKAQGDYFRLWLNRYYPTDAKAFNLDKSGAFDNSTIRKAFNKYGVLYKQQVKNWDKVTFIPPSFASKFGLKDNYDFSIQPDGKIRLIVRKNLNKVSGTTDASANGKQTKALFYSDGSWNLVLADNLNSGYYGLGQWWASGTQANISSPSTKKQNLKADNFYKLASVIAETIFPTQAQGNTYGSSSNTQYSTSVGGDSIGDFDGTTANQKYQRLRNSLDLEKNFID